MKNKLIFIYNADSGIVSAGMDWLHKLVSPDTYQCDLCGMTYGHLGMKKKWKNFLNSVDYDKEFVYKDQVSTAYPELIEYDLPVVALKENGQTEVLLDSNALKGLSLDQLEAELRDKLKIEK